MHSRFTFRWLADAGVWMACSALVLGLNSVSAAQDASSSEPSGGGEVQGDGAEDGQQSTENVEMTPEQRKERALALFRQSAKLYSEGDFNGAVGLLEESYRLTPNSVLLYNLGRAREGSGDFEGAVSAYRRYLDEAEQIPDRGAIEARIRTLESRIERGRTDVSPDRVLEKLDELVRKRIMETNAGQPAAPPRKEPVRISPVVPWTITGVGVAAVGVGALFQLMAQSKHDDAESEPVQAKAMELQNDAKGLNTASNVMFIAGGVVAAGGLSWALYQLFGQSQETNPHKRNEGAVTVGFSPTAVHLSGRF